MAAADARYGKSPVLVPSVGKFSDQNPRKAGVVTG
jgi:hypothetical protein